MTIFIRAKLNINSKGKVQTSNQIKSNVEEPTKIVQNFELIGWLYYIVIIQYRYVDSRFLKIENDKTSLTYLNFDGHNIQSDRQLEMKINFSVWE